MTHPAFRLSALLRRLPVNELTGQHELIHLQTPCGLPYVLPLNITHLGSRKATEQNRQNKQRQEGCSDKAANNHAG